MTERGSWHRTIVWMWSFASFAVALVAMEPYSAWVHRAVWHGPLWSMHRSHHRERIGGCARGGIVANDVLSASHAPVSMALIAWGFFFDGVVPALALGAGLGMAVFGALYVVFHDGMVHGRLPVSSFSRMMVFARMKESHARHHRTNAAPYGFFASPWVEGDGASTAEPGTSPGR